MKRILYSLLTLIMAMAIIIRASAPALADPDSEGTSRSKPAAALMIKAPNVIKVGQPLTITVLGKRDHETIAGASVYALKASDLVVTADSRDYTTLLREFEATAEAKGVLIGTTGNDGAVTGKLTETGRFMLVATKDGFIPGFDRLTAAVAARKGLNIRGPGSAAINTAVIFTVTERYSSTKVAGAAVYARLVTDNDTLHVSAAPITPPVKASAPVRIQSQEKGRGEAHRVELVKASKLERSMFSHSQARTVKPAWTADNATVIRSGPDDEINADAYAAGVQAGGFLLGNTDANGQVAYTFTAGGTYILAAIKDGYIPAFAKISVRTAGQARLGVKAPPSAATGDNVTIGAFDQNTGQAVAKAAVYAFRSKMVFPPNVKPSPAPGENGTATQIITDSSNAGIVSAAEAQMLVKENKDRAFLIGYTGDSGEILYTFSEAGAFVLVAVKDGYIPGGARINILSQPAKALVINAVINTSAGQSAVIKVTEKSVNQPVSGAAVYVLKINDLAGIKPMPPTAGNFKSQGEDNKSDNAMEKISPHVTISGGWMKNEASTIKEKGTLAGNTDGNGQVTYSFASSGQYLLAAFKDGYTAAFTYVICTLPISQSSLYIKAASEAAVGDSVPVLTTDASGKAVGKAAVYLVRMDTLSDAAAILQAAPSADLSFKQKYGAVLKERSSLQGYTDDNGNITVKFSSSGLFMLLAIKDGFLPDFVKINIKPAVTTPTATQTVN